MKHYRLTAVFLLFLVATGCKKILEEKPRNLVSPDGYFTNAANFESAVIGIYSSFPAMFGGNQLMMSEMFGDMYATPSSAYEQALPTYQNSMSEAFYNVRQTWSTCYTIIKDANFVLAYLPDATVLPDEKKAQLTGECRFLRAYAYFRLVQFYGDVPLRKDPPRSYDDTQIPRTSQEEVYDFIVEDLKYAEASLPDNAMQEGRVYRSAATALLAKVYLTMAGHPLNKTEHYQNALTKSLETINSGKFTLVEDYAGVFRKSGYTTESIWEQTYAPGTGNGIHSLSLTQQGFVPILLPAGWFVNSFTAGDRRGSFGIIENFNDAVNNVTLPVFFAKFVDTSYINQGRNPGNSGTSFTVPFLRLGEMYLIAAEAENEMNGPGNAYQYINKIRWRAREDKNNPAQVPDFAGLSQLQLRDSILLERKKELFQEGSTWFDLKRTGTLTNIQTLRGGELSVPIGTYNDTWYIPDTELSINKIPQNPRYQ